MKALFVFDNALADQLVASGVREITTQYGIKQDVRVFEYVDTERLCFDIRPAMESGKCRVAQNLFMAF